MKNWKEVVEIKKDKKGNTFFIVNEEDFYKYKFNTQEWEQSIIIKHWEHDWIDKTYKITYEEMDNMACFPG